jgi:hypothetical protein
MGCWGMRLGGLVGVDHLLVPAPATWPLVSVVTTVGPVAATTAEGDGIAIGFGEGGRAEVARDGRTIRLAVPELPAAEAMVHPFLANPAALASKALGRETFHAGAVVVGGGAWAIIGHREGGKSTSLAWFESHGYPVVTDDVLAVGDGRIAFAGPRCLDLRPESALAFGRGEPLGQVGNRERWRVRLGQVAAETPLAGWVFLEWGDRLGIAALRFDQVARRLIEHQGVNLLPDPARLLDLATLPALVLTRPRTWSSLDPALQLLGERLQERRSR